MIEVSKGYKAFSAVQYDSTPAVNLLNFFKRLTGVGGRKMMALDGASFEVKRGEVFGLLGPNGAGKTTIIKILSTLLLPDSGEAYVDGIDVVKRPRDTVKRLQAVLSSTMGFDPRLTGRSNLQFFADLYGIPKVESKRRIDELFEFAGISEWADVMSQRYSSGMLRKLLVSRALLSNATVFLFDEPTANLDPISASDFRKLIRRQLADEEDKTILLATHNLWEAEQICDRIALLKKGRIIAVGTPEEIKQRVSDRISLSIFVTNFLPEAAKVTTDSLLEVRGVRSVEIQENAVEIGHTRLYVEGDRSLDYNRIFERLSFMRLEIASIESSQPSLEEAFLKLNLETTS